MLDWLKELVSSIGGKLLPFQVIKVAHQAGVLRFGKYHRTCSPGFHWKWPFAEEFVAENTAITTQPVGPQTLTTLDDVAIVVSGIVKYQVSDVEKYQTQCWDQVDALRDVTMGAIRKVLCADKYDTALAEDQERRVLELVRKEVNQFGFKIHRVTFTDLARIKTFRLMTSTRIEDMAA